MSPPETSTLMMESDPLSPLRIGSDGGLSPLLLGSDLWSGSDWARRQIHLTPQLPPVDLTRFPSHGHIDLLPRAQGKGVGRKAMDRLMTTLQQSGSPGMHLGLSPHNRGALAFYHRLGFATLDHQDASDDTLYVGMSF